MGGMAGMGGMGGIPASPPAHPASMVLGSGFAGGMGMWTLMVTAMMLPTALPAVRHVASNSLRARRPRAMATFAVVYLAIWVGFGALALLLSPLWSSLDPAAVLTACLALAAGWQLTAAKRGALRDCHLPTPLPPRGRRATAGVIRFGARNGLACVRSCWAMMLAMAVATSAPAFWMVAVTGIVATEKLFPRPRQASRAAALLLAAGALVVGAVALI
jgi:predicted metal-binding membrane protein